MNILECITMLKDHDGKGFSAYNYKRHALYELKIYEQKDIDELDKLRLDIFQKGLDWHRQETPDYKAGDEVLIPRHNPNIDKQAPKWVKKDNITISELTDMDWEVITEKPLHYWEMLDRLNKGEKVRAIYPRDYGAQDKVMSNIEDYIEYIKKSVMTTIYSYFFAVE